ncbi:ABC transporter ATP-binding protein [Nocardioidaceae bacterium]|nr:ABC transporter ATP-binding protein [Nocardioidaceae bacterium]
MSTPTTHTSGDGSAATGAAGSLHVRDLTVAYGPVRALKGVSLEVPAGQLTAVLGANGAGKTTLLRTISGLVRPASGEITFDGEDVTRTSSERLPGMGLSQVPEGRGVITELTVEENLRLGALGRRKGADARSLDEIYEQFPILGERRSYTAHTLSGGERQMLVIGRALLASPTLLLLDEPSLGLAPRIVSQIFGILRGLVDDQGLSVLLVEQNAKSALSVADHGVVLNLGEVVADAPAADLADDDQLRRAYLGF